MIHPVAEIQPLLQIFHLIARRLLMTLHILLIAGRLFRAELALKHVRKRVRYLRLACEDAADECGSLDTDRVN